MGEIRESGSDGGGGSVEVRAPESSPGRREVSHSEAESMFARVNSGKKTDVSSTADVSSAERKQDLSFAERDDPRLGEVSERAEAHYEEAERFSSDTRCFENYSEHKSAHIEKVYDGVESTAGEFNRQEPMPEGYASLGDDDVRTLKAAALYHDTGMDGGRENLEAIRGKDAGETLDAGGREAETLVRSNHGENAALNVLSDREAFERAGVDPDQAAVDCMVHSKSGSGVRDLRSDEQWAGVFNEIDRAADERGMEFDKSKFMNEDGTVRPEAKERCASHAYCMRVADANGHDMTDDELQSGERRVIDRGGFVEGEENGGWESEAERNTVLAESPDGSVREVEDPRAKAYAMGEGNIRSMDMRCEDGQLVEHVTVDKGDFAPESTMMCVEERAGELATARGVDARMSVDVDVSEVPPEKLDALRERYEDAAERIEAKTENPDKCAQPVRVDVRFVDAQGNEV